LYGYSIGASVNPKPGVESNGGQTAMIKFTQEHKCNKFCRVLGLTPFKKLGKRKRDQLDASNLQDSNGSESHNPQYAGRSPDIEDNSEHDNDIGERPTKLLRRSSRRRNPTMVCHAFSGGIRLDNELILGLFREQA
jgi:hypothetical protein